MMFLIHALLIASEANLATKTELPIKLPSVKGAFPMVVEPSKIQVGIHADGRYVTDSVVMSKVSVEEFLSKSVVDNPFNQQVIIHADRDAKYQYVATLIDICNRVKVP
jgi:biopolymer transport protein ExbD